MGQNAVIRQAVPQRFPYGLLGHLSVAELRFFRNTPHCASILMDCPFGFADATASERSSSAAQSRNIQLGLQSGHNYRPDSAVYSAGISNGLNHSAKGSVQGHAAGGGRTIRYVPDAPHQLACLHRYAAESDSIEDLGSGLSARHARLVPVRVIFVWSRPAVIG